MKYECDVILDMMPLYRAKRLSDKSKEAVEVHLSECAKCRSTYNSYLYGDRWEEALTANGKQKKQRRKKARLVKHLFSAAAVIACICICAAFLSNVLFSTYNFISSYPAAFNVIFADSKCAKIQQTPEIVIAKSLEDAVSEITSDGLIYMQSESSGSKLIFADANKRRCFKYSDNLFYVTAVETETDKN